MSPASYDVVVIGGGLAGAVAALVARACGKRVALLRRAWGATAMSSGAVDVAADAREGPGRPGSVAAAVRALAQRRRHHPYALLGARAEELIEGALGFLRAELAPHLSLAGAASLDRPNLHLATPLGTVKPTALAQASMARADLGAMEGATLAVLKLRGTRLMDADLVAAGIARFWEACGVRARAVTAPVRHFNRREHAFLTPGDLAWVCDEPKARAGFAESVGRAAREVGATVVLAPASLGLSRSAEALETLSAAAGAQVAEVLAEPPSVPGLRLVRALEARLAAVGVDLKEGEAFATPGAARLDAVRLVAVDGEQRVAGNAFVLATGRFIGGGIAHRDGRLAETVFGLPVWMGARRAGAQFMGDLTAPLPGGHHLAFQAGVRVDASMRPLAEDGAPAYENLFAAGSVVTGYDPARDKCGLGTAALTGWLAGLAAAGARRAMERTA